MQSVQRIPNRQSVELFTIFQGEAADRPLALLAHGFNDVHDTPHMRAVFAALQREGHNVLRWDSSNSWGRSGGSLVQSTLSGVYRDMQDVVKWSRQQEWTQEPFVLVGHSMGAAAALWFAAENPKLVKQLILLAPVVRGKLLARRFNPVLRTLWWFFGKLPNFGQKGSYLGYNLLYDGVKYDGIKLAPHIKVPTTIIVAEDDQLLSPESAHLLHDALPAEYRSINVIAGADHSFSMHLGELEEAISEAINDKKAT